MSHHLAEMMDRVEHEKDVEIKEKYQQQTVELILKIWDHRSSLNEQAYPLARFKKIIDALSILSPEANVWERNRLGRYESLAADSFSMVVDLYRALHFIDFVSLKSVRSKEVPPVAFSDEEKKIYDFLINWAKEEIGFRSSEKSSTDKTEFKNAADSVCNFIDKLCARLNKLKCEISDKDKKSSKVSL